ncbi:MAG: NUDIX domain-containing protein [Anaerolineales bacterium]
MNTSPEHFKFCPRCGNHLGLELKDGKSRPVCSSCRYVYFADPKVAACVLVDVDREVLLVRRATTPHQGKWVLPAGFVDAGEDPVAAGVRECREETGLIVRITALLDVHYANSHPGGADIVIVYTGVVEGGSPKAGDDAAEVGFFPPDALPPLGFSVTKKVLTLWQRRMLSPGEGNKELTS